MTVEINMRLDCGRRYTEQQFEKLAKGSVAMLSKFGPVDHRVRRLWMDQPRHLVAQIHADDIPEDALFNIARKFRQNCLAIYYPARNEGRLVGPMADDWGPFDLKEFERFDDDRNPPRGKPYVKPKYVPSEDPEVERAKMGAMHDRVLQAFPDELWTTFAP